MAPSHSGVEHRAGFRRTSKNVDLCSSAQLAPAIALARYSFEDFDPFKIDLGLDSRAGSFAWLLGGPLEAYTLRFRIFGFLVCDAGGVAAFCPLIGQVRRLPQSVAFRKRRSSRHSEKLATRFDLRILQQGQIAVTIESPIPLIVLAATLVAVGFFIRPFVKYGLKGRLFGARIVQTVGKVQGAGSAPIRGYTFSKTAMKIHVLEGAPGREVGLEFIATGFGSYQMIPFALSDAEARKLMLHLQTAVERHAVVAQRAVQAGTHHKP